VSRYLVIIEESATGFSAFLPDLPGCIATGATRDEVANAMQECVEFHLEGLRESGDPVPPPCLTATYVEVARV
jgi:predicted RNase H-like HicB family nuclease